MSTRPTTKKPDPALIEWIVWSAIATGLIIIYLSAGQRPPSPSTNTTPPAVAFVGLVPLAFSTALRWVLLPRIAEPPKRLTLFILGVAMAEGCGVFGIFLGGPHKDTLFTLSLLGIAQFFPAFLPRLNPTASPFR